MPIMTLMYFGFAMARSNKNGKKGGRKEGKGGKGEEIMFMAEVVCRKGCFRRICFLSRKIKSQTHQALAWGLV